MSSCSSRSHPRVRRTWRIGVPSSASWEPDVPAFVALLAPLFLAIGLGMYCNFFYRWNFASTDPSGVYTAFHGEQSETPEVFAVNVDPKEGDLAKLSETELRRGLLADVPFQLHGDGHRLAAQPESVAKRSGGLAKPLLYLLLGLLLLETYLARRFGHHAP